ERQRFVEHLVVPGSFVVRMEQHVRMRVDQSRHQCRARKIDRRRAGWRADLTTGAGGDDAVAGHEYRPAGMWRVLHTVPYAVWDEQCGGRWNGGLPFARLRRS